MIRRVPFVLATMALCCILVTGCAPQKMSIEEVKAAKPARPAELDQLNTLVGTWEVTCEGEMKCLEKPIKSSGTMAFKWAANKCVLLQEEHYTGEMGDESCISTWTWDPHKKKFLLYSFDGLGSLGKAKASYCPKSKTWYMEGIYKGYMGDMAFDCKMTFVNDNKIDWTFNMYDGWKMQKYGDMTGTCTRK